MRGDELVKEAAYCRNLAPQFAGKPEQPVLLKIAATFERLAAKPLEELLTDKSN